MGHDPIATTITVLATFAYTLGFSAGLYEALTIMPQWFVDPPMSLKRIKVRAPQVQGFWIPQQIATMILLISTVIFTWNNPLTRPYILVAFGSYLLALASTGVYFLRKLTYFMNLDDKTPASSALTASGKIWYSLSLLLRTLPQGIGSIALLIALTTL